MSLKNFYVCGGAFESKCQTLTYLLWTLYDKKGGKPKQVNIIRQHPN